MKKISLIFLFGIFFTFLNGQSVLKIDNQNVSLDEFKSIFYKNNHETEITKEYLSEYMDLFVNFKLKVKEAIELGLDTNQNFINELEGYRKQLAKPYLKNKKFDQKMLDESYSRIQKDINASHILIKVNQNANDNERKIAFDKALKIKKSIIEGAISFSEAAKKYSDDKSALTNEGNLGYFTAFMMVYNFESAAYNTSINEISEPVKTKYGYHLIKVNDIRSAVGKVSVAHIMFKTGNGASKSKINDAKTKIDKVLDLLNNGEDFMDIAERFSEDRATAVKGGILPEFGVGKMLPEFEDISFSIKNIGDISQPFLTDYGWHIIKLIDKSPIGKFDDIQVDLRKMIEKDSRNELSQKALYEKLKKEYIIKHKPKEYSSFRKKSAIKVSKGIFKNLTNDNTTLLTIDSKPISNDNFAEYIVLNQSKESDIDILYNDFINKMLLNYEDSKLEEKYPEYKALLKEYREGILLFDLTNEKVWSKAVEDTLGLQKFYNENQTLYSWPERVNATIYSCINLDVAKNVKRKIYRKNRGILTDAEILVDVNKKSPLSLQIESNKYAKGDNKYIDQIMWEVGISKDLVLDDGTHIIIDVDKVLPVMSKELNETRGKVISDYQNQLEKDWIINLKAKYKTEINYKVLYSLIK